MPNHLSESESSMQDNSKLIYQPNVTQIPNIIFDYWMGVLSPAEFKVLICICRKTFGWQKRRDAISLRQIENMTGLSRMGISKALQILLESNLINKIKSKTADGDDAANQYEINVINLDVNSVGGGSKLSLPGVVNSVDQGVVNSVYPQKKLYTKQKITKETPPIPPSSEPSELSFGLSSLLFKKLQEINPKHKKPNLYSWTIHIDRMIRIDNRSTEEIRQLIEWLPTDSFWIKNIQSTEKLREKFDQLWIAMTKPSKKEIINKEEKKAGDVIRRNKTLSQQFINKYQKSLKGKQFLKIDDHYLTASDKDRNIYVTLTYNEPGFEDKLKNILYKMGVG